MVFLGMYLTDLKITCMIDSSLSQLERFDASFQDVQRTIFS